MADHTPRTIERHGDVAVVGGSAAGLAAALQIARQRRSVIVVDAGDPRNAPAAHMHGYLGLDGMSPGELTALGRAEVRSYGGEVLAGRATAVTRTDDGRFRVELTGGHAIVARRVLAATGLVDELPDIDGLGERWGRDVVHCPFCHGYEVRDQRVVQIVTHPMGAHAALLMHQLTHRLTVVLHEGVEPAALEFASLRDVGVPVIDARVARVVTADDRVVAVELADGRRLDADVVLVGTRFRVRAEAFAPLGLQPVPHASGLGDVVTVDARGATDVAGVYAAGNVADPMHQVLHAAADGSRVGAMICADLAHDDLTDSADRRRSAVEADWDRRYGGEQIWSGNPNGSLVAEMSDVSGPVDGAGRRALDVGAGEGGDAVWLAEQGWKVTANDISGRALDRVAAEATRRGLVVDVLRADVSDLDPFGGATFDLVTAHYASIHRSADGRAIEHLLAAVAPGGMLLVVGHDLTPMREPVDTAVQSRAFDPDAYVGPDDVAAAIDGSAEWTVEVHERRPRPAGAHSHHVDDIILRARRGHTVPGTV